MSNVNYVTQETLDLMKEELNFLTGIGRQNIAKAIAEAREKGDLKENAEYDAAKEAQGIHEAKISKLQSIIANSRVLDASTIDLSKVSILTKVRILNLDSNSEFEYQIVSEKEADLKNSKISVNSPIGSGLLGKAVGDVSEIKIPNGTLRLKVLSISL